MSNPARELHLLLSDWRARFPPKASTFMNVVDVRAEAGAAEMLRVYRLLARIDDVLRQLEADGYDVQLFRRHIPAWIRIPLGVRGGWSTSAPVDMVLPRDLLDQIEALALYLDGKVYEFDVSRHDDLRTLLRDVRHALEEDVELPLPLKLYIHRLLSEIQQALDNTAIGEAFDFADAIRRLWIALGSAENSTTDDRAKSKWRRFAERILFDSAAQAMVTGGQAAITLAIDAVS